MPRHRAGTQGAGTLWGGHPGTTWQVELGHHSSVDMRVILTHTQHVNRALPANEEIRLLRNDMRDNSFSKDASSGA